MRITASPASTTTALLASVTPDALATRQVTSFDVLRVLLEVRLKALRGGGGRCLLPRKLLLRFVGPRLLVVLIAAGG